MDYLPPLVAVAASTLTYLFCVRPMRRGSCRGQSERKRRLAAELELARAELELLRLGQGDPRPRRTTT